MTLDDLGTEFPGAHGYLNTASMGLPPSSAVDALTQAIRSWQDGRATAPEYDAHVNDARAQFAALVQMPEDSVAVGAQVSALVGMIAAGLAPGARVLCPHGEFTSVIFPFLARKDLEVVFAPLEDLANAVQPGIDLVAFSLVQSANGQLADADAIEAAARTCNTLTLVDLTQAAGWLPVDAGRFDFTVTGTYKWLLSPRGTAFMTVRPGAMDVPESLYAGWYAGESPWESIYGAPLRLASSARRFDLSPAWLAWVGTAHALRVIAKAGLPAIHEHNLSLANAFREQLGLPPGNSAIVSLDLPATANRDQLQSFSTAIRAGQLRVGFHLYNRMDDVVGLVRALVGSA